MEALVSIQPTGRETPEQACKAIPAETPKSTQYIRRLTHYWDADGCLVLRVISPVARQVVLSASDSRAKQSR